VGWLSLLNKRARRFFVNSTATACKTRNVRPIAFFGVVVPAPEMAFGLIGFRYIL
jgi:hypothetical protein